MTRRTYHIGLSFAIVVMAYWAYAVLAVPWIEAPRKSTIATGGGGTRNFQSWDPKHEIAVLFSPQAWQRSKEAKSISNEQVMLLWQNYVDRPNGWVDLKPLTVIFIPQENGDDPQERMQHAMVLEVPAGANLRFDRPLDLNRGGGIGRLIEGQLRGEVTIRRRGKRSDHQDDLWARTRDIELTEQRITTPNLVEFQYGPNTGRGRQMEIKLLPRLGAQSGGDGPNVGGIEQIAFEHVEQLQLEPLPSAPGEAHPPHPAGPLGPGSLTSSGGPVEITCHGPFRFHLVDQVATFRDQVDVFRTHPDGPSDHLHCDLLSVFFTRAAADPKGKASAAGFDLQPSRIETEGSPTTLDDPIDRVRIRSRRLQYSVLDGQVYLEDPREVVLQKDQDEIHTQTLRYRPGPPNHPNMFQMFAGGPGWLRGSMGDRQGQQLEARWRTKLAVRPQDEYQVISLTGGAVLNFQAMGQLAAEEIHFWLHEAPATAPRAASPAQPNFQPDRLLALGQVEGVSPQLSSKVERLEVRFSSPPMVAGADAAALGGVPPASVSMTAQPYGPAAAPQPYVPSTAALSPLPGAQPAADGGHQSHIEVTGRLLQARVVFRDQQHSDVTEVTVVDRVHLQETQTATPGELPLLVTGNWLHVTDANTPGAKVAVLGKPAHMEGRGMNLTGPDIAIDRGANTLAMRGPGTMQKLLDRDLENRPLPRPGNVRIDWRQGMFFDGRKAHFQDGVQVNGESQKLETEWLDLYLEQPVSFAGGQAQQPATVGKICCGGGVYIVNRTLDGGMQTALDRIHLRDLVMDNVTGDIYGSGPGRVISVRRGGDQELGMPAGPLAAMGSAPVAGRPPVRPAAFGSAPSPSDPNQTSCLDLKFMKSITGNKNRKELVFHGQVRAARAAVTSWTAALDDDDPNRLGPKSVVLHCENLELDDMSPVGGAIAERPDGGRNMEFQAIDNVTAEGNNFTARAARLSYSQGKDLWIFEGDGRSDAELYKQETVGGPATPFKAGEIRYFSKTGNVEVDAFRSFDMPLKSRRS